MTQKTYTGDDNMGFMVSTFASCCEDDLMSGQGTGRGGKGKLGNMTREQLEKMF